MTHCSGDPHLTGLLLSEPDNLNNPTRASLNSEKQVTSLLGEHLMCSPVSTWVPIAYARSAVAGVLHVTALPVATCTSIHSTWLSPAFCPPSHEDHSPFLHLYAE